MPSQAPERINHPLKPIFDGHSRVLVLGTIPSPTSRAVGCYYGHPQNRFWRILARLFDEPVPQDNGARTAFVLGHGIALWDVLASCNIVGASDASIAHPVPNDLSCVFDTAPITTVFTTGTKATDLYRRLCAPRYPLVAHRSLPSPSAANARASLDDLVKAYRPLSDMLVP